MGGWEGEWLGGRVSGCVGGRVGGWVDGWVAYHYYYHYTTTTIPPLQLLRYHYHYYYCYCYYIYYYNYNNNNYYYDLGRNYHSFAMGSPEGYDLATNAIAVALKKGHWYPDVASKIIYEWMCVRVCLCVCIFMSHVFISFSSTY